MRLIGWVGYGQRDKCRNPEGKLKILCENGFNQLYWVL